MSLVAVVARLVVGAFDGWGGCVVVHTQCRVQLVAVVVMCGCFVFAIFFVVGAVAVVAAVGVMAVIVVFCVCF